MSSEARCSRRRISKFRTLFLLALSAGCSDLLGLEAPNIGGGEEVGRGGTGSSGKAGSFGTGGASGTGGGAAGGDTSFAGEAGEGSAGEIGNAAGGEAGEVSGGVGGEASGAGKAGAASGGDTGTAGAGGIEAGAGRGGESGAGGAPIFEWPTPDAHCPTQGALACYLPNSVRRFVCDAGKWVETVACDGNYERCDRRTGACGPTVCQNVGDAFCSGHYSLTCGPDRVTQDREHCALGCDLETGACEPLSTRELRLDHVESAWEGRPWPDPLIPVCFRDAEPDAATRAEKAAVRLAVDTSWGRYSGAAFVGWSSCSGQSAGVEIELVDDCSGELARLPRAGYPGPGQALPVELCRSYIDLEGTRQPAHGEPTDLALLAFVAKHVFGHVIGREHTYFDRDVLKMMARAVDLERYSEIELRAEDIEVSVYHYGNKPPYSLVVPNGRCLALSSGEFKTEACDGSPPQRFQSTLSSLVHVDTDECVRLNDQDLTAGMCTGEESNEAFRPENVRWIAAKGQCVSVLANPAAGESPLAYDECDPLWPADETFSFEFSSAESVRIRTANGTCVKWPTTWGIIPIPELGPCDGSRDVFEVREGRLGRSGQCLYPQSSRLRFRPCADYTDEQFYLSGQFTLSDTALALLGTGDDAELTTLPVAFPPSPEQIFDYHF
jgi:hypothetical protein